INQIVQEQIIEQQIPMLTPYEGVGPDQEYYLTPDSLVIYYQPYVYTPGAYGVLEFTIPYTQISGIVCPVGPIGEIIAT
ncbi:MAG TPA: RsiV family protein, partial [Bacillota bacterium]|nr:RsiV family protein [Bacillota bacterium]